MKYTYKCEKLSVNDSESIFDTGTTNNGLVDSGCPELVAGKGWIKTKESTDGTIYDIFNRKDNFKFGDKVYEAKYFKKIPLKLGNIEEILEVAVIDANIPLLFSKRKLMEWGAVLDFHKNTLKIGKTNETFKLKETKGGHLALPLNKDPEENKEEFLHKIHLIQKNQSHQIRELKRLHRVFGHPRPERIQALLKDAGMLSEGLLKKLSKVTKSCQICHKYQKAALKPKVGLPMA